MEQTWTSPLEARPNSVSSPAPPIRDFWPRLMLSPLFGLLLPTLSGLINPARHSAASLLLSYIVFSLLALLVWDGNRRINYSLSRRDDWLRRPLHRVLVLLTASVAFTIPVSTALLLAWRAVTGDPGTREFALPLTVLAILALVVVITHVYEAVYVLREWETARVRAAEAETARLTAELERLASDIGPHFLFNNLNALQHLIECGDPRAASFVEALSDTYRYLLQSHTRPLVPLADELQSLERHRLLASRRYRDQVTTQVEVDPSVTRALWLPPTTLGELLLNAVKHSRMDDVQALVLRVSVQGDVLRVENRVFAPSRAATSTRTGLANLAARVRLCTGREMTWGVEGDQFVVTIPLARVP